MALKCHAAYEAHEFIHHRLTSVRVAPKSGQFNMPDIVEGIVEPLGFCGNIPKEIKNHEYRVGLTRESVSELVPRGHRVVVEANAGIGIGALDELYLVAGAEIVSNAEEVFARADMIVKVKEALRV